MLCDAYEPPLEQKLDALPSLTDIGDEQSCEFGLEVQRLASDATLDNVLKRIYVRCLPKQIVTAITGKLDGKLKDVVAAADKAWTASKSTSRSSAAIVSAIAGVPASANRRGGCGGRQKNTHQPAQLTNLSLCSFHKKFGDAARKCVTGCSRWNEFRPREAAHVFQVEEALDGEDSNVGTASEN